MLFRENIPLAPYTTFHIGGPARWFVEAASEEEVVEAAESARSRNLPLFILGGGSNLLVSDHGFSGLVLRIALKGIRQNGDSFTVSAGEDWDGFVSHAVGLNYGGIECLAGIPGTVGGTPVQNVGAYGQEVAETIVSVRAFNLETLDFEELPASRCGFAYRSSIFNSTERGKYIVTAVDYRLHSDARPKLSYADLKRYFEGNPAPSLAEASAAIREIRRGKGMLIVGGDSDCHSAGSFFKNPVVTPEHYARIAAKYPNGVPNYPAPDGQVKLPAAWLVEQAGFYKGYALGEVGISSRHTLALINRGHARAADVFALRNLILAGVAERFAIHLEPEPVLLG